MLVAFFPLLYGIVTLATGTLAGLVRPSTSVLMTALFAVALIACAFLRPKSRLGGGGDAACVAFLVCAFATAAFTACPERSLHLAVQYAAAAALFYLVLDADRELLMPGMSALATLAALFGLGAWMFGVTPRVAAPFGLHHYAAGYWLLHLPITWRLASRAIGGAAAHDTDAPSGWAPAWIAALVLQAAAILGTLSLAAIIALAAAVLWTLRRRPLALIALAIAIAAVAVYVPRTRQLLERGEDPSLSTENRVRYLRTGAAMIAARPLGWGLGTVPLVAARYRPQTPDVMPPGEVIPHLHNLPLQLATESGVLGFLAAAWFLWRARSLAIVPYAIFTLADYQFDMPSLLFAAAAVAALFAIRREGASMNLPVRIILLGVAAVAPFQSTCGWNDFSAAKLPDLIPLSSAQGALDASIPALERATQLDPYFTLAWYHLGYARAKSGDRAGAVAAYAESMLVLPVTVFAENWDASLYSDARAKALAKLEEMRPTLSPDARTTHRYEELRAFLTANPTPPQGEFSRSYSEITDAGLERSTSLLVFHEQPKPKFTSTITVRMPKPDFYIPAGIGYLKLR